jgi:hypothetical protein
MNLESMVIGKIGLARLRYAQVKARETGPFCWTATSNVRALLLLHH